jgi:PTS system nitrogen regulatory IIA component
MNIDSILAPERTFCNINTRSKKNAIEKAATLIANSLPSLDPHHIFKKLIEREKLGPTALGHGIAVPHCRIEGCSSIVGSLFTLETPVDFAAYDDTPVNIMFVLLVPIHEVDNHLKAMAMLAEKFESSDFREKLQTAKTGSELFERALST